jgi:hypothetical protein
MNKNTKKLTLAKETILNLTTSELDGVNGGTSSPLITLSTLTPPAINLTQKLSNPCGKGIPTMARGCGHAPPPGTKGGTNY